MLRQDSLEEELSYQVHRKVIRFRNLVAISNCFLEFSDNAILEKYFMFIDEPYLSKSLGTTPSMYLIKYNYYNNI